MNKEKTTKAVGVMFTILGILFILNIGRIVYQVHSNHDSEPITVVTSSNTVVASSNTVVEHDTGLKIGQVWELKSSDPFKDWVMVATVVDIKEGYVQYKTQDGHLMSNRIIGFVRIWTKIKEAQ